ncbi:MAG: hypothetical protein HQM12_04320 [SAR324 cluster bacterium]|nr:hypothetical protein [SAR324 cluster bacterium]
MIGEIIRLSTGIKHFLSLSLNERTFVINIAIWLFICPILVLATSMYQEALPHLIIIALTLLTITIVNLIEVRTNSRRSYSIYLQIFFVVGFLGFGASILGSVSTGLAAFVIFLVICYYLIAGIQYSILLGVLSFLAIEGVVICDFVLDIWPYYWIRDLQGLSGQAVHDLLAITRPGKFWVEMIFMSSVFWTLFLLRAFDNQLQRKTLALEKAHKMLQESKNLSDVLLNESQQKQHETQDAINQLLEALRQIGENNMETLIPEFDDPQMKQLSTGVHHMLVALQNAQKIDKELRQKEQHKSRELERSIELLLDVVEEVGHGNLTVSPPDFGDQALNQLSQGLQKMIDNQYRSFQEEERHKLALTQTNALAENAPTSLMLLNAEGIIKYMNPASRAMLTSLQHYLPVPASTVLNQPCSIILKNDELNTILLDPTQLPFHTEIQIGNEWIHLEATPVYDSDGNFLGPTLAWQIITIEKIRKEQGQNLQKQVRIISQQLASASQDLLNMSEHLAVGSSKTFRETQQVVIEAKEIQSNIRHIANAVEQMANILTSNEQLVARSTHMSGQAVESSQEASKIISALGKSSMSIGVIIQLINRIAQQTNILALNATIQATRAGEVGKGFGVVAREVKALAQQTSEATKEISTKIKTIQKDSKLAVEAIQNVSDIIEEMNDISGKIYTAIEDQTHTTHEITSRMEEAAKGAHTITSHIDEVAHTAENTQDGSERGRQAVVVVDRIVANLNKLVTEIR